MRPKLSKQAQMAMNQLTSAGPQGSDPFERMVAGKITGLSMELERLNNQVASLRDDLETTDKSLTETVGEYQGWTEALVSYYESKRVGQPVPVGADGGTVPSPPQPKPAAMEADDQSDTDGQDKPQGDDPKGKPQEAGESEATGARNDPASASEDAPGQPDA